MATTPQALRGAQVTDSTLEVSVSAAPEPGTERVPSQTLLQVPSEEQFERTEAFEACVEDVRRAYLLGPQELVSSLQHRVRRRLGLAPVSAGASGLFGLSGVGIRLAIPVLATALAGQWSAIPWGRWAVILAFYGLIDASRPILFPAPDGPVPGWYMGAMENWTALLPTIVRESDLRDLAAFTRRLMRMRVVATAGVVVAAIVLAACWLFAPSALGELPAGSIALLALLLFDFGVVPIWSNNLINWATMAREARYEHHLFWPSPADSPEVQKAMHRTIGQASLAGMWITIFLVLTVVLVGWGSPLVPPLAVGFVVIGYLTAIGLAVSNRASVRKIVERSRKQRLQGLQSRIDAFGSRYTHLASQESAELRDLLFLHDRIRNAPATPTTTHTLLRTAAGLLIPTIAFVITVFGEVSAERILDAILP